MKKRNNKNFLVNKDQLKTKTRFPRKEVGRKVVKTSVLGNQGKRKLNQERNTRKDKRNKKYR